MADVRLVGPEIWQIDVEEDGEAARSAAYLVRGERGSALIETGTQPRVPLLIEGLAATGLDPEQLDWLVVTHVHLDHAGGAGELMQHLRRPVLLTHTRGRRHMIDPSRLWESARIVYGSELLEHIFGRPVPVAAERVRSVSDGERLDLGGRELRFLETEGHSRHHICVADSASRGLFSGDTAGIRYGDYLRNTPTGAEEYILPTTTPNQFDPEALAATTRRLLREGFEVIFYTHFGASRQVRDNLERNASLATLWTELAGAALGAAGLRVPSLEAPTLEAPSLDEATAVVREALAAWLRQDMAGWGIAPPYETTRPFRVDLPLNAMGLADYLLKRRATAQDAAEGTGAS